jgi:hypothetical protein
VRAAAAVRRTKLVLTFGVLAAGAAIPPAFYDGMPSAATIVLTIVIV